MGLQEDLDHRCDIVPDCLRVRRSRPLHLRRAAAFLAARADPGDHVVQAADLHVEMHDVGEADLAGRDQGAVFPAEGLQLRHETEDAAGSLEEEVDECGAALEQVVQAEELFAELGEVGAPCVEGVFDVA